MKAPEDDYVDDDNAREAPKLVGSAGCRCRSARMASRPGLGSHWEMWSFVRGGMTPLDALAAGHHCAGAVARLWRAISGRSRSASSPTWWCSTPTRPSISAIRDKIDRVMLGGRLYEAKTMNEVVSGTKARLPYWWETK